MSFMDQGGGGGRAGGEVDDNYALDKPYDITGMPNADKQGLLDEMLNAIFKALARIRTDIATLTAAVAALAALGSGGSSGSIPAIVNQYYYAWMANYDGSSSVSPQAFGTHVPTNVAPNTNTYSWVQTFTIPFLNMNYTATTTAGACGYIPSASADGRILMSHGMTMDTFMASGTPLVASGVTYRYWFGLFNQSTVATGSSDTAPSTHFAAFRYSTTVPDTNWQAVTRDGSTTTVTDLGVAFAQETEYHLKIRISGTTVYFSINGGAETAVTATVPGSTQELAPQVFVYKDATGLGRTAPWYFNRMVLRVGTALNLT